MLATDLRQFASVPDEEWKELVLRSISESNLNGAEFPKYTHKQFLGSKDAATGVCEAYNLYKLCKPFLAELLRQRECSYLDFGCGAGRIFRMFVRNFDQAQAIGVDCVPDLVEICRRDFKDYHFEVIPDRPPISLPTGSLDVITAYSVFSHFSAIQNTRWIDEFARLMRPGGLAFLTTYSRGHLKYLETSHELPKNHVTQKERIIDVGGFREVERILDLGEMMYYIGVAGNYRVYDYGWAYLGREFVERAWGRDFEVVDFIDDYSRLEQALVVLRRR